jgi:hypothetical protein
MKSAECGAQNSLEADLAEAMHRTIQTGRDAPRRSGTSNLNGNMTGISDQTSPMICNPTCASHGLGDDMQQVPVLRRTNEESAKPPARAPQQRRCTR